MAGADADRSLLKELARREELIQKREEAVEQRERAVGRREEAVKEREEVATMREKAVKEREGALKEKEEAMKMQKRVVKREEVVSERKQKPKKRKKRAKGIRESATGSSSPPRQPPPPEPAALIHKLPDEVLERIFALLDLETIVRVLSVCQRWRDVIEDRCLIKELEFAYNTFTTEEALRLMHSAPGLKSLELSNCSYAIALLDAASVRCTNLLCLKFWSCGVRGSAFTGAIKQVFETNPRINELHLEINNTADWLPFHQELGVTLPDLRKLTLDFGRDCHLVLDALVDSCSCNQLQELKIWNCVFLDSYLEKLVQYWGGSLRVLHLESPDLRGADLALLAGFSELRRLRVSQWSDRGDALSGLANLSHLEELCLSPWGQFGSEVWCSFFSQSKSRSRLRKLSLTGGSWLNDTVLASVAASCPQLEELQVWGGHVTNSGLREVLQGCRKLNNLDIVYMNPSVGQIVPELPQLAPQLRRINISKSAKRSLSDDALSRVQEQMPHLRIDDKLFTVF